jgi:hypothetical protein
MSPVAEKAALPRVFLYSLVGLVGAVLAVCIALWAKYGTAIFFEAIRNGLASCFG